MADAAHPIRFGIQTPQQHTSWQDMLSLWQENEPSMKHGFNRLQGKCRRGRAVGKLKLKAGEKAQATRQKLEA